MMKQAKDAGYEVELAFIGTSDVSINMERVRNRVLLGGHDIPVEDQLRRYPRSTENLQVAFEIADMASLYDNSSLKGHRLLAVKTAAGVEIVSELPEWAAFLRKL